jgi:hypothetical protein
MNLAGRKLAVNSFSRWERVGVRGCDLSKIDPPHPTLRVDLSPRER